jgi:hypothetical protein
MIIALATKSAHASAVFNDFMLELIEEKRAETTHRGEQLRKSQVNMPSKYMTSETT